MKILLAAIVLIGLAGCDSNVADFGSAARQPTSPDEKMVALSDVQEVMGVLFADGYQVTAWRSGQRPMFIFNDQFPSTLFTVQESKDFVDSANEVVDSLSLSFESLISATSSNPGTTNNDESVWFVVKYRIGDSGPCSVFVHASRSERSTSATIDPPKDLVDRAYTRKKDLGESDDTVVEPDTSDANRKKIPFYIKHFDEFSYRLELPESDRIF